jgi:hypothetical protein
MPADVGDKSVKAVERKLAVSDRKDVRPGLHCRIKMLGKGTKSEVLRLVFFLKES